MHSCLFCSFSCDCPSLLLDHTVQTHKHEARFRVKCSICGRVYRKLNSLRMHQRRHPTTSGASNAELRFEVTEASAVCEDDDDDMADVPAQPSQSIESGDSDNDIPEEDYSGIVESSIVPDESDAVFIEELVDVEDDGEEFVEVVDKTSGTESTISISDSVDISPEDPSGSVSSIQHEVQKQAAQWLMNVKENCNTTQKAIDEIVAGVDRLVDLYTSFVKEKILMEVRDGFVSKEDIMKVFNNLEGQSVLEGVQTAFKQRKYVSKQWQSVIKPKKVILKKKAAVIHGVVREVPDDFGYVVPFLEQLGTLLQNDAVLQCINNPRPPSEDSVFRSVLDGYAYRTHPVVVKYPNTLAIILYLDDIQPADPLSSKTGQKLRTYYWVLGNIYPELRSSLRAINILSLVQADVAKAYDNRPFLEDFVNGINRLSSDEGVKFLIKGEEKVFHGILLFCVGDTPASANIGGFKESPAFSKMPCRQCMATKENLYDHFEESSYVLRTKSMHAEHITALKDFLSRKRRDVTNPDEDLHESPINEDMSGNPSVKFGVNAESIIMEIKSADVTKCLPQDIMHIFAEGILALVVLLVLRHAVKKGLSLTSVNEFLLNLNYGHLNRNKPSPIEANHLKTGLRQTSAQMFLLAFLIPFIVKGHCDPAILKNFVCLLMIVSTCLSFELSVDDAHLLRVMIKNFLVEFKKLHPGALVPKMHFMIHLPTQIFLYGPLIQQWAMRFEAFHSLLKRLTRILHNMKNLSYSLITRMLFKRALEMESSTGQFLYGGHSLKVAQRSRKDLPADYKSAFMLAFPSFQQFENLEIITECSYYGALFKLENVILIEFEENKLPLFGVICQMYSFKEEVYFVFKKLLSVKYICSLNAYQLSNIVGACQVLKIQDIVHPSPLLVIRHNDSDYVLMLNYNKQQYNHFLKCPGC